MMNSTLSGTHADIDGIETTMLIGGRDEQQDAVKVNSEIDENFARLDFKEKITVLQDTIQALDTRLKKVLNMISQQKFPPRA